jgi:hypothetical protein
MGTASGGNPSTCHCSSRPMSESSKKKFQGPLREVHDCDGRTKSGRGYWVDSSVVDGGILGSMLGGMFEICKFERGGLLGLSISVVTQDENSSQS